MTSHEPLLVITGPTASGKTDAAVTLAQRLDGELIGADSVQIYRGFNLGASKPTLTELRGIPHHLIDICEPDEAIDAADYARLADAAIADVRGRNKLPIVVGGSGLWLRALLRGLVQLPKVDPQLRAMLTAEAQTLGTTALHTRLRALDPDTATRLHPNDSVRIVRALEVHAQTGRPLGALHAEHALGAPRYRAMRVVLDWPHEPLHARIAARTQDMFERGLVAEVTHLLARHGPTPRAFGAVGYREVVAHLIEHVPLADTIERVTRATRIYARRQRTWLNNEPGERWTVHPTSLLSPEGMAQLAQFLHARHTIL